MLKILLVGILTALMTLTVSLHAQESDDLLEMSLDDLMNIEVSVASKKAESINDAPGIITVVTKHEIEGFGAQHLGDVINRVVSMSFLSANVFTDNIGNMRASATTPYDNHVLILMNGRPVRDPISGGLNQAVYTGFPLDMVERLEIIRGPGSVLYGSCAYAGVINIVTKRAKSNEQNGSMGLTIGNEKTYGGNGYMGFAKGDFSANIGVMGYTTNGPEFEFTDYSEVKDTKNFWRKNVSVAGNFTLSDFQVNTFYSNYRPYGLNGPNNSWDINEDGKNLNDHEVFMFDLGYTKEVNKYLDVNANITFNNHYWNQDAGTEMTAHEFLSELMLAIHPNEDINILLGGTFIKSKQISTRFISEIMDQLDVNSSVYTQIDYRPIDNLKLIAGAQMNMIEGLDANISPRVGAIYNFTKELGIKLLYSSAFRKAYPLEYGFNHPVFRGNPDIKPELINTFEGQLFYQKGKLSLAATGYYSKMSDIIIRTWHDDETLDVFGGYLKYGNGGDFTFYGVEFEAKMQLIDKLLMIGSFNWQVNNNPNGLGEDIELENAALHPNIMLKAGFLYDHEKLSLGVFASMFGKPYSVNEYYGYAKGSTEYNKLVVNEEGESYVLLSAKITLKLDKLLPLYTSYGVNLSLEAENILGETVRYPEFTSKGVNTLLPLKSGMGIYAIMSINF